MWRAVALLWCIASGAAAQSVDDISDAVAAWLDQHDTPGVIAVMDSTGDTKTVNLGLDPATPVDLASLSKAITATCAASLVADGTLAWDDPVNSYVPGFNGIRVRELVTHEGGITQDATQIYMSTWLNDPTHRASEIVDFMRDRDAPIGPQGTYAYSNDNYALLAEVIEAAAGEAYAPTCLRRAVGPAKVTAVPSQRAGAFLSWGGWAMTVEDYLRFHAHWFDTDETTVPTPTADIGGGAVYGLGMLARPMQQGINHWHFGALCFPAQFEIGTYVVALFNGWRVIVAYDTCVDWPDMVALDNAIVAAIFKD